MSLFTDIKRAWNNLLSIDSWQDTPYRERMESYDLRYDYYGGSHRRQMKVKPNQPDDNTSANFVGLTVDRSVSMLLGGGIEFDLENQAAADYLAEVWEANKKDILLHKAAQHAAISGTGYVKIIPEGVESRQTEGRMLPRLVALDPRQLTIETNPEDIETVEAYTIKFLYYDPVLKKDRARKEITRRNYVMVDSRGYPIVEPIPQSDIAGFLQVGWVVENYISGLNGEWELQSAVPWPYEFAPILHWQNLPQPGDCYGASDVEDVLELQDRWNFIASNINRIIRYHAHPKTIGTGFQLAELSKDASVDSFWTIPNETAKVNNLEMQSDLESSRAFANDLRQAMFDVSRTVDIASMKDKLGQLTNFGLRVLFFDALAKLGSKQELLGEALSELNHRLLVLAGVTPNLGGEVVFDDPLPTNETEETQALTFDLTNKLLSRESASKLRGYDYEQEKERIDAEQKEADARMVANAAAMTPTPGGPPFGGGRSNGNQE
jgi:hypothetical protein